MVQSPPDPVPVTTVVPDPEDEPLDAELVERPSPERTVTDGPPLVELVTPFGPAVTELERPPALLELFMLPPLSERTTVQGSPLALVPVAVVPPEVPPDERLLDEPPLEELLLDEL